MSYGQTTGKERMTEDDINKFIRKINPSPETEIVTGALTVVIGQLVNLQARAVQDGTGARAAHLARLIAKHEDVLARIQNDELRIKKVIRP